MTTAQQLILNYQLQAHPEGGWFKETYRSQEKIPANALPNRFTGERNFSTAILFMLEQGNFSAFHKIKSDECWHFYAGGPLHLHVINKEGVLELIRLGSDADGGERFQYVVPAGCWFASEPSPEASFCLTGCTVAPGFDFLDFELANASSLRNAFPHYADTITRLCR